MYQKCCKINLPDTTQKIGHLWHKLIQLMQNDVHILPRKKIATLYFYIIIVPVIKIKIPRKNVIPREMLILVLCGSNVRYFVQINADQL